MFTYESQQLYFSYVDIDFDCGLAFIFIVHSVYIILEDYPTLIMTFFQHHDAIWSDMVSLLPKLFL